MSALAILIVILGVSIVLSRAPLVVAPQQTRDAYLRLFDTDSKMRLLAATIGAVGVIAVWAALGVPGTVAAIVNGFGLFMGFVAFGAILLPGLARKFATSVWTSFGTTAMRFMGALAVIFGLFLVYYGLSL